MRSFIAVLALLSICSVSFGQKKYDVKPDVVYGHKDGMALTYDVFLPKQNARGIGLLFMVSGGWVSQWAEPDVLAATLIGPVLEKGYTVFAVRHGSSPKYVVPECVADVKLALQHIYRHAADHGVDKSKLGVFGFSAGGHLSLVLGTQSNDQGTVESNPRVAAVVAVFPPTDLAPYVEPGNPRREQFPALKFDPKKAVDVSPLFSVTADDAPTRLIHGDKDELVPLWHSEKIVEAFKKSGVKNDLVVIEGAGHGFDAKGNKRMFDGMVDWFDQMLKSTTSLTDKQLEESLQGKWSLVRSIYDGREAPKGQLSSGSLEFQSGTVKLVGSVIDQPLKCTYDTSTTPCRVTMQSEFGEPLLQGIVEVNANSLRLCYRMHAKKELGFPASFESKSGSGLMMIEATKSNP